jgi:CHAD domain-containing protein
MSANKWIAELDSRTPLADAARRVLTVRLEVVHDHLPLALHKWKDDPEYVHQLRVGTRRAGAALDIFGLCLPRKAFKRIRGQLKAIRRAAGQARDWDVFGQALIQRERHVPAAQKPGLDFVFGLCVAQRTMAQAALEGVGENAPFDFERLIAEALAGVAQPDGKRQPRRLGELARPWLAKRLDELRVATSEKLDNYERLHEVRILGKRLRYGMEVFADCFKSDFKDRYYPMVEQMQEILGHANDSHVASQRLTALRELVRDSQPLMWNKLRAGIDGLVRYHQHRLAEQRRHFLSWWKRWQASDAEAKLRGMLKKRG